MNKDRKLFLFIAMSLDGYIAKQDDDIGFLSMVEQEGQDYGYGNFIKTIDTVILGRKTYDKILEMGYDLPYGNSNIYVFTHTSRPATGNVNFYAGNLSDLVMKLKNETGKNIYCDGGAETINELLKENLVDEIIISVIPILLGNGISFFKEGRPETKLKLVNCTHFERGLVQLHYARSVD